MLPDSQNTLRQEKIAPNSKLKIISVPAKSAFKKNLACFRARKWLRFPFMHREFKPIL